jgi:hypothetical protein
MVVRVPGVSICGNGLPHSVFDHHILQQTWIQYPFVHVSIRRFESMRGSAAFGWEALTVWRTQKTPVRRFFSEQDRGREVEFHSGLGNTRPLKWLNLLRDSGARFTVWTSVFPTKASWMRRFRTLRSRAEVHLSTNDPQAFTKSHPIQKELITGSSSIFGFRKQMVCFGF